MIRYPRTGTHLLLHLVQIVRDEATVSSVTLATATSADSCRAMKLMVSRSARATTQRPVQHFGSEA